MKAKQIADIIITLIVLALTIQHTDLSNDILGTFDSSNKKEFQPIIKKLERQLSNEILVLYRPNTDNQSSKESIHNLFNTLNQSNYFSELNYKVNIENKKKQGQYFLNNARNLLAKETIIKIQKSSIQSITSQKLMQLYSPLAGAGSLFKQDPLFLLDEHLSILYRPNNISIKDGYFLTQNGHYIIYGKINNTNQVEAFELLKSLKKKHHGEINYLSQSFFTVYAKQQAIKESQIISIISFIVLITIFLFFFKSINEFVFGVSLILKSLIIGLLIIKIVFGTIHSMALLLSISVIGLIADYIIHYFVASSNSANPISKIQRPLIMGAMTTIIGFSLFFIGDIQLFKQVAIFAISSLVFACLFVIFGMQRLTNKYQSKLRMINFPSLNIVKHQKTTHLFLLIITLISLIYLHTQYNKDEDVRSYSNNKGALAQTSNIVQKELGLGKFKGIMLVRGKSIQEVLENEEKVKDEFITNNINYHSLTHWIPSVSHQEKSNEVFRALDESLLLLNKSLNKKIDAYTKSSPVTFDEFNKLGIKLEYDYFLGKINDYYYTNLPIYSDIEGFKLSENLFFYEKVTTLNNKLIRVKEQVLHSLFYLITIVFVLLFLIYGLVFAMKILAPPIYTGIISLALFTIIFKEINLFSLIALLLIIVLSFDYSIFHFFAKDNKQQTSFAVSLSCLTTLTSFGILGLSQTHAVASFGIVISTGIVLAYVLSPLSQRRTHA